MKAALYIRVSTEDQAREGYSIPAQLKALNDYCKKENINVYNIYIDEGEPGSKENRPKFQTMLKDANKKLFDIILVHKFDRFARKVELSQRIKGTLRKNGVNVISITEPIENSPIGFFQEGMLELLSEYYIKNLSQEVKKGQREKISQGKVCNMLAYGYKNINGNAIIVEDQSNTVKKIYELYNKGYGSTKIANYLNKLGISTMKNGIWNSSQINYILRNEVYTGAIKWSGEIYKGKIPIIISEELFALTQSKISTKLKANRTEYYNKFLLLGILKCGYCGSPMRISKLYSNGNRNAKVYYMYTCRQARYSDKRCNVTKHHQHDIVEKQFVQRITDILKGNIEPENITDISIDLLSDRKQKIESDLDKAKKAYFSDTFTLEEYKKEKNRLENELKFIELENVKENRKKKLVKELTTMWDKFKQSRSIQEKKALLQENIKDIKIYEDTIIIDFQV